MKPILVWDEFVYLLTQKRIIVDDLEREKLKRYSAAADGCANNPDLGCMLFCKEFNFNQASNLFDGEENLFKEISKNFDQFKELLSKGVTELLKTNPMILKNEDLQNMI